MEDEKLLHAKQVYLEKKYEEANSLFSEIIASTNNYIAVIYKGFNNAYQTTLETPHHVDMVSGIKQGYEIVRSQSEKPINYVTVNLDVINEIDKFTIFSVQMYLDKFNYEYNDYATKKKKITDYNKYSGDQTNTKYVDKELKEIEEKYAKEQTKYMTGINLTAVAYNTSMEIVLSDVMNNQEDIYTLDNYITLLSITKSIYYRLKDCKVDNKILEKSKELFDFCNKKVSYYQDGIKEEYWNQHKGEKEEIETKIKEAKDNIKLKEDEIQKLETEKSKLTLDLNMSISYRKQQEFKTKLETINNSINSLGVFDLKKKKDLLAEKMKTEDIIRRLDNNIKSETADVEAKFNDQKKAIDNKINQLQNDIINLKRSIDLNEKLLNQNR